ncbi:hypothetical protein BpHYR1_011357 [Brachionus plicatilis]|uniref:Uncharacterized protein n=1 Tax=Brachionus plicatilis TaxID=10195 RepID=A0A3M7SLU6_BRAPC|nr:hypothetical protein BpHYR1_011357 [Brachionus plicatilis]
MTWLGSFCARFFGDVKTLKLMSITNDVFEFKLLRNSVVSLVSWSALNQTSREFLIHALAILFAFLVHFLQSKGSSLLISTQIGVLPLILLISMSLWFSFSLDVSFDSSRFEFFIMKETWQFFKFGHSINT